MEKHLECHSVGILMHFIIPIYEGIKEIYLIPIFYLDFMFLF